MIKVSVIEEDITIINVYAPNQKVLQNSWSRTVHNKKKNYEKSTIIVQDFNTPFWVIGGTTRQKISRSGDQRNITNHPDLTDI